VDLQLGERMKLNVALEDRFFLKCEEPRYPDHHRLVLKNRVVNFALFCCSLIFSSVGPTNHRLHYRLVYY